MGVTGEDLKRTLLFMTNGGNTNVDWNSVGFIVVLSEYEMNTGDENVWTPYRYRNMAFIEKRH